MSRTVVCVTKHFNKPRELTDLVVFSDQRNYIPHYDSQKYLGACCRYAAAYQVYVVPTRFIVDNRVYTCLIGPDGKIIGVQAATHLNLTYQGIMQRGLEINVFDTPLGKIFLSVDTDIYHPEVIRAAKLSGAEIVIASQYIDSYQYNESMITKGVWNAAQSNDLFVVGVNNNCIAAAAPIRCTQDRCGYLVTPCEPATVVCKLFLGKLEKDAESSVLSALDHELYHRYHSQLIHS